MYNTTKKIYLTLIFFLSMAVCANAQEISLKDLINKALQNNQSVKSSILETEIADKRVSEVKSSMLPQVNVSGDYKYYTKIPVQLMPVGGDIYQPFEISTPWNLGTTISVGQLIFSQEYITGVQMANTGKDLNRLLVRKSKEEVAYNVSAAYYNAQIINTQSNFIRSNITNMEKLISTAELLYENQMIKHTDVDKLKLNKTMLETQEKTVKVSYNEVINMLKFLSGISQSDNLQINNEISTNTITLPSYNIEPERIEVKLLEKQKELNLVERKNITAGYFPSLSAYGVYNNTYYGKGGDAGFLKGLPGSWVGLKLSWNLFDGLGKKSKIDQKNIEYEKLNTQLNQMNENISMELKNSIEQITLNESTILSRKEQLDLAQKIYDQTQLQFKEGLVNITDVIQSDNSLREAQNNYIVSTINLLNAQLAWKKAAGKLLNN
ncbi:MAG: TolC family protein [Ignavibacteria bacterium]|nr:TolC family protein [Ignavibacteria bacterium]